MKIKLVFIDGNKKTEVGLSERELHDLYDILYIVETEDLEANKIFFDIKKWDHIIHDIIGDGAFYKIKTDKFIKAKEKCYIVKKPRWVHVNKMDTV